MTFNSLLNKSVSLQTKASSQNSLGEWSYSYTSASTPTICRLSPLSASERMNTTGRYDDVRFKCYLESGATITRDNRLIYNSETYRIKEAYLDSESHHITALLVLIE